MDSCWENLTIQLGLKGLTKSALVYISEHTNTEPNKPYFYTISR